jgi:hypothetical protein
MKLTHHKAMPEGPELVLEAAVYRALPAILPLWSNHCWSAGSARIGGGLPDILVANWRPEIASISGWSTRIIDILTYFKSVARANVATAAAHLQLGERALLNQIAMLVDRGVLGSSRHAYFMTEPWRRILTEVASIEVKVDNWQQAIIQARRNQLFVDRSYVALPSRVAARAASSPNLSDSGIGVIAVSSDNSVKLLRRARAQPPRVWAYYFRVAALVAGEVVQSGRTVRYHS